MSRIEAQDECPECGAPIEDVDVIECDGCGKGIKEGEEYIHLNEGIGIGTRLDPVISEDMYSLQLQEEDFCSVKCAVKRLKEVFKPKKKKKGKKKK